MPDRFIFRQVYFEDIALFIRDGEVRAKQHAQPQLCHQTSYQDIVDRRGTAAFAMPCGGVVNDYVPFYFSPITAFTFTIYKGNVRLRAPDNSDLGTAVQDERAFLVARTDAVFASGCRSYFSNVALNTLASEIVLEDDPSKLSTVVNWSLFDESPTVGRISEIGYDGVCRYFHNLDTPVTHQNRRRERMAEFLVREALPLDLLECVIVHNDDVAAGVKKMLRNSSVSLPVYVKPGCYF